jgi:hypothetical protein
VAAFPAKSGANREDRSKRGLAPARLPAKVSAFQPDDWLELQVNGDTTGELRIVKL